MTVASTITDLGALIDAERPTRVMLFTGGASYAASGAAHAVDAQLASVEVLHVANVTPNPTIEEIEAAIALYRSTPPDLVLAIGGGSVIDLAKSVRLLAVQDADARAIVVDEFAIETQPVPMVAVPTTSGTGSEATHFSVVYVDGRKHSLAHEWGRPTSAIVDPTLSYSMPPSVTAETGLDALAQAIESLWSVRSTDASVLDARTAMHLAVEHLHRAVHDPTPASRAAMSDASHRAGRAIDITTTTAPHALSYAFTSRYGVPHGHAVALTLGAVLEYNGGVTEADCNDPRGVDHVRTTVAEVAAALGADSAHGGRMAWERLVRSLGLQTDLASLGVDGETERISIADAVDSERLSGNPREFSPEALRSLILALG